MFKRKDISSHAIVKTCQIFFTFKLTTQFGKHQYFLIYSKGKKNGKFQ